MVEKCPKCNNTYHVLNGGLWERCPCVAQTNIAKLAVRVGVDVRFVNARMGRLKTLCTKPKYSDLQNYLLSLSKAFKKKKAQKSLALDSASTDLLSCFFSVAVRTAFECNQDAVVYHICDFLMTISEQIGRQALYYEAARRGLVCFDLTGMSTINDKGLGFANQFISMVCRRRLREGKATIVGFSQTPKLSIGGLKKLLDSQFDRVKL